MALFRQSMLQQLKGIYVKRANLFRALFLRIALEVGIRLDL